METKKPKSFQDFITNSYFIKWVKDPDAESELYWQNFLRKNPSVKKDFDKAKYVIKTLHKQQKTIDEDNVREIWSGIQNKLGKKPKKIKLLYSWKAAATLILLVGLGSLFYLKLNEQSIDFNKVATAEIDTDKVTLVLSDGNQQAFDAQQPSVSYLKSGLITIDSSVVIQNSNSTNKVVKNRLNQLIVPYGKRSMLYLSDGTEVILNSGSHIVYPVPFSGGKREVYLKGEAYLKVAHNADSPFFVKTDQISVQVLGTEFNVKAYDDENSTSVVLVNGKVEAQTNVGNVVMAENEKLTFRKNTASVDKKVVDVNEFVSWKDGWMYCRNESIAQIATKLSRYYNLNITFQDEAVGDLTMTGKLNLRSGYKDVLDVICFSAPIQYSEIDKEIVFETK